MNFCSLSSGSSGNCYYIGNGSHGILIDAGISALSIRKFLSEIGVSMQSIMGVLITHNHSDHIRGLEVLTRRNNLFAFTTEKIRESLIYSRSSISGDTIRKIPLQQKFNIAGFDIEAFPVSHDAPETIGFHICSEGQKITIATDLGHICPVASPYIKAANLLVIESNYDEQMLLTGRYPHYLKARIRSDRGHLSNYQTSAFLADNISDHLSHVCIAHLSKNNNTPAKAIETLMRAFSDRGLDLNGRPTVMALNRNVPSEMICLN